MTHMAIRLRMESQNRLLNRLPNEWQAYTFPTVDALVRFGIQSARDGWEVKFPDGSELRRAEEASVGTKSLTKVGKSLPVRTAQGRPLPPKLYKERIEQNRPKFHNVPPDTEWRGQFIVTRMADGLELTWDTCGLCANGVTKCSCSQGITAPNSVRYIHTKTAGMVAGTKWEDVDASRKTSTDTERTPAYVQPWRENRPTSGGKSLPKLTKPTPKRLTKVTPIQPPSEPEVEITDRTNLSDFDTEARTQATNLLGALTKRLTKNPSTPPPSAGKKLTGSVHNGGRPSLLRAGIEHAKTLSVEERQAGLAEVDARRAGKSLPTKSLPKSLPVKSAGKPLPRKKAL